MWNCFEFLSCCLLEVIGYERFFELVRSHERWCIKHGKENDCVRCSKCLGHGHTYSICANKEFVSFEGYHCISESEQLEMDRLQEKKVIRLEYEEKPTMTPNTPQKSDTHEKEMIESKHLTPPNKEVALLDSESMDRISGLPDKILCHILAFLPTRCVVATTILSKRWKYVWTDVPVLDFTELPSSMSTLDTVFNQEQYVSFKKYVNRVLLLNGAPCLKCVRFEAYEGFFGSHIIEWMLVMAKRYVENLYLTTKHLFIALPSSFLLAKEKLVVLKLDGLFELNLPHSIHLPCLQSLSLIKVVVPNEHNNRLSNLLSSCPVLEELYIEHCEGLKKFSVCSTSIKTLTIYSANYTEEDFFVETPNVEILYLSMGIKQPMENGMSSLVDTRLNVWTSSARWIKLLQRIRYTKILVLHRIILDGTTVVNQLPIFQNLTHLEVGIASWSIILQIMSHAPKLVSFTIHNLVVDRHLRDMKLIKMKLPLERIEYHGFDVDKGVDMVRYFLSNSTRLKLIVYTRSWLDIRTKCGILRKLLNLCQSSDQCKIIVVKEGDNYESVGSISESELSDEGDSESELPDESDCEIRGMC